MARSLVSTFTGVALDLVCHGYPLHQVQFPLEPELELNVNHCIMFYALEFTLARVLLVLA